MTEAIHYQQLDMHKRWADAKKGVGALGVAAMEFMS